MQYPLPPSIHTHHTVNAIINSKFAVAATEGIRTNCSCIKSFDGIDDIDMLHILSNTLDNAITASEKITDESERFINLDISKTMDIYRIVVRNAINESVLKRNPYCHNILCVYKNIFFYSCLL